MSRFVLVPLAVALSALLLAPEVLADPSPPLFVVEQQRSALVARLAKHWSDAFAAFPKERRLWGCSSDRNLKTVLVPLDGMSVLERVAALAVYQWVAKDDPRRIPHAGPTAQDSMAAFGLGDNDKMIGFADAQGVLFAAVQGLNAKFEQVVRAKDTAIAAMKAESDAQKQEIADLRRAVEALMARRSPDGGQAVRR